MSTKEYNVTRFLRLASEIRAKGKTKSWRHTTASWSGRDVESLEIPHRAIRVGHNTWAYFYDESETTISIQYHHTDILHLHSDGSVELWSEADSISTKARYREFARPLSVSSVDGRAMAYLGDGTWYPLQRGITSRAALDERTAKLWLGARVGDSDAANCLAEAFDLAGIPDMAELVRSENGRAYSSKGIRKAREEWEALAVPVGDRWFLDAKGRLDRPVTERDVLMGVDPSKDSATLNGAVRTIANGSEVVAQEKRSKKGGIEP